MEGKRNTEFPEKAVFLFKPAPFKVLYGGRGSSKTWDFCRALLILGTQKKNFILCAREIQKSIAESVHRVLEQQAFEMGMGDFYRVLSNKVVGTNGTEFVFAGIRNNITAIKSMEGIDICAVFEATGVTEHSWQVLLPTVRGSPPRGPFGQGPEVWVEFNPELATDHTYKYWILDPPAGTVKVEMNFNDNPWFPDNLRKQMEETRKRDYDSYLTIWKGKVRRILQGAIYAKELEKAISEKRVSPNIHYDASMPVDVSADLGRADMSSLCFWQQIGNEHRVIAHYANFGFDWSHYLDHIQERKYAIRRIYLPHDAENETVAAAKSIYRQTRDAYPGEGKVITVDRTKSVVNDINAVRLLFPRIYINEKDCSALLHSLAHYRYEVDPETRAVSDKPLHDWSSHDADSVRCYVMGMRQDRPKKSQAHAPREPVQYEHGQGWMQ